MAAGEKARQAAAGAVIVPEPCSRCGSPWGGFILLSTRYFGGEGTFFNYRPVETTTCLGGRLVSHILARS